MSERNTLRHGDLEAVEAILTERSLTPDETRAVLLNLIGRLQKAGPPAGTAQANPGNVRHNHSAGSWACPLCE